MKKSHLMCIGTGKFGITRHLQVLLCLLGQSKVFEEASCLLRDLIGLQISAMQVQRVSEYYGAVLDKGIDRNIPSCIPRLEPKPNATKDTSSTYVMLDRSMVFTREEKWKELKLARVFKQDSVWELSKTRKEIKESIYVSHLGSVEAFLPKLERHLTGYKNMVILGDGARWIWKWSEDNFPGATQILDFFHAKEKLVLLSKYFLMKKIAKTG